MEKGSCCEKCRYEAGTHITENLHRHNCSCHTTPISDDGWVEAEKAAYEKWEEAHYRELEAALNDFKNGRIGYSQFIDQNKATINRLLAEERERAAKIISNYRITDWSDVAEIYKQLEDISRIIQDPHRE